MSTPFLTSDANKYLGYMDTIHDFWKNRGKSESDGDEGVSVSNLDFIQDYISELLSATDTKLNKYSPTKHPRGQTSPTPSDSINSLLGEFTNKTIKSATSNYERNVVDYFETQSEYKTDLGAALRETLSFQEIIEGKDEGLWEKMDKSKMTNKVLDIYFDDTRTDEEGNSILSEDYTLVNNNKKTIANFIINYFYPGQGGSPGYLTFDANTGFIGKIFRDIPQINNLVMPQNIADSATTSFNQLNGRNEYYFPPGKDGKDETSNTYQVESNTLSKDKGFHLTIENKKFSNKNNFGFSLGLQEGKVKAEFPFGPTQTEGPSVNYLVNLQKEKGKFSEVKPSKSRILNIGKGLDKLTKNKVKESGIILDLKRIGDHEQARASQIAAEKKGLPVVFVTIDHLCALYARLIGQNTIWHYQKYITLYRFPTLPTNKEELKALNMYVKTKTLLEISIKYTSIPEFMYALDSLFIHCNEGITTINFVPYRATPSGEGAAKVITRLLRLRMRDICDQVDDMRTKIKDDFLDKFATKFTTMKLGDDLKKEGYDKISKELEEYQEKLQTIVTAYETKQDGKQPTNDFIADNNESYVENVENFDNDGTTAAISAAIVDLNITPSAIKSLEKGEELTFDLNKTLFNTVEPPDKNAGKFIVTSSIPAFNFIGRAYGDLYNAMTGAYQLVVSKGRPKDAFAIMVKIGYFDAVRDILNFHKDVEGPNDKMLREILSMDDFYDPKQSIEDNNKRLLNDKFGENFGKLLDALPEEPSLPPSLEILEEAAAEKRKKEKKEWIPIEWRILGRRNLGKRNPFGQIRRAAHVSMKKTQAVLTKTPSIGGGQEGGTIQEEHYRLQLNDMNDLLQKITTMAASFIQSAQHKQESVPGNITLLKIKELLQTIRDTDDMRERAIEVFNDIRLVWDYGMYELEAYEGEETGDSYKYVNSITANIITVLLSFYSEQKSPYLNIKADKPLFREKKIHNKENYGRAEGKQLKETEDINLKRSKIGISGVLPVEVAVLFVLTLLDNVMTPPSQEEVTERKKILATLKTEAAELQVEIKATSEEKLMELMELAEQQKDIENKKQFFNNNENDLSNSYYYKAIFGGPKDAPGEKFNVKTTWDNKLPIKIQTFYQMVKYICIEENPQTPLRELGKLLMGGKKTQKRRLKRKNKTRKR